MTIPIAIGLENTHWHGRRTLARSAKLRVNIPRRVTPRWHTQSNQSGYSHKSSPRTRGCVFGSGEYDPGNRFASSFLWKYKIPLTNCRISKYDDGQDNLVGTPESSNVSKVKVSKFSAGKRGTNLGRYRGWRILQCLTPSSAQGIKVWLAEQLVLRKLHHTQGFSWRPTMYQPAPNPMSQKHRCLTEPMRYYGISYSIVGYRIFWFIMRPLKCYPPQPPEPLRWIRNQLQGAPSHRLHQRRPSHCASQQGVWQTTLSQPTGLHLSISMRQTPNLSGPYQIREGYPSGKWQGQIDEGIRYYPRFMGLIGLSHHWCQTWQQWCGFLQIWANASNPGLVGNHQEI